MTLPYTKDKNVQMFIEDLKNFVQGKTLHYLVDRKLGYQNRFEITLRHNYDTEEDLKMIIIRQAKKEDFEVLERLYNELEEDAVLYQPDAYNTM